MKKIHAVSRDLPVSIHAPPEGRDLDTQFCIRPKAGFNPRAPGGARSPGLWNGYSDIRFNPRAPGGARSIKLLIGVTSITVSIHAPPEGRDANDT